MTAIALLGSGGNMGTRITRALRDDPRYELRHVEPGAQARARLESEGIEVMPLEAALDGAEIVVFAVPDAIVRHVAADVMPRLAPGTSVLLLDPAAIAAARIPERPDVSCFVTHPTHPPLYSLLAEADPSARRDFWGGGLARQSLVFAQAWGDPRAGEAVSGLAAAMFAPVTTVHTVTVDQMAMLEPALSETLTNGCLAVIKEGLERVVAAGVPREAAADFCMGHLQIGISIIFGELDWKLSAGAALALEESRRSLFRDDWDAIFEPEAIRASVRQITGGDDPVEP